MEAWHWLKSWVHLTTIEQLWDKIKKLHPGCTDDTRFMQDILQECISMYECKTNLLMVQGFTKFYREYTRICHPLVAQGIISDSQADEMFLQAFNNDERQQIGEMVLIEVPDCDLQKIPSLAEAYYIGKQLAR